MTGKLFHIQTSHSNVYNVPTKYPSLSTSNTSMSVGLISFLNKEYVLLMENENCELCGTIVST